MGVENVVGVGLETLLKFTFQVKSISVLGKS